MDITTLSVFLTIYTIVADKMDKFNEVQIGQIIK